MRQETIDQIKKEKLIVIVRGIERKKLIPLAEAMYNGGIRLLEVTYSANGGFCSLAH
jgi:2-dehydro-3-deoxyphosphogluconate aldolase/(4S)-4-hydroxy-2-oxoglutarate aldolase